MSSGSISECDCIDETDKQKISLTQTKKPDALSVIRENCEDDGSEANVSASIEKTQDNDSSKIYNKKLKELSEEES